MKTRQTVLRFVTTCPLLVAACFAAEPVDRPGFDAPSYTDDGSLRRPSGFRNWVFVGASLGLSYSPSKGEYGKQLFHNAYLDRRSYQGYAETGAFPERSMLAMAVYRQASKDERTSSLQGSFEGEMVALEVAVKDSQRFAAGWAYFDFSGVTPPIPKPFQQR